MAVFSENPLSPTNLLPRVNAARVMPDSRPMAMPAILMSSPPSATPMTNRHPMNASTTARTFLLVILSPNRKKAKIRTK